MKKLLTFLATFALFAGMANAQITVTTEEGSTATPALPFVNNNADGWSQSIYTAEMLGGFTAGGTIYSISYNLSLVATGIGTQDVTIYMANTSKTNHNANQGGNSDWLAIGDLTQVYHNASFQQPTSTGWFTITLDTPFEYTGGSLAICIAKDGTAAYTNERYLSYTKFNDVTTTRGSLYKTGVTTAPTSGTGTLMNNLPNLKISISPSPANIAPDVVAANTTTTSSATLTFTRNPYSLDPDNFRIEYGRRGFTQGTGTVVNTPDATLSYTLTGLDSCTWYDVYVSSVRGGAASGARKASFHTETTPLSLPYTFAFVSGQTTAYTQSTYSVDNEKPLGWEYPGQAAAVSQVWLGSTGNFSLRTNNTAPSVVVMPELNADLRKVVLNFNAGGANIEYGYWYSDAFTSLGIATSGANSIDLEDLGANIPAGARLAFSYTGTSASLSIHTVGTISVEDAPSCKVPSGIALDATTLSTTAFTMRWGGVQNEGDKYHVVLRNSNNYSITTNIVAEAENVTDQFYAFSGLDTATNYFFSVSKVCATEGETEAARFVGNIITHFAVRTGVNNDAMGSVVGQASGYYNTDITLTAVPKPGYEFVNWTVLNSDGVEQSGHPTDAELDLTLNLSNRLFTYKANFQEQQFTLTVATDPADITTTYGGGVKNYGASVPVYVESVAGYDFVGWSDGAESTVDGSYIRHTGNVSVKENKTVTAYFVAEGSAQKRIVATVSDEAAGSIAGATGTGLVAAGTAISIGHTTNPGYTFNGWYVNGTYSSSADTWTGTADGHKTIVAKYTRNSYAVTIASNDVSVGTVAGAESGTYEHGTVLTLVPNTASNKVHFREWVDESDVSLGSNVPFSVTVEAAKTYTAIFYKDSINVSVERNLTQGGTVHLETVGGDNLGSNTMVAVDDQVKLVADLADHYHFEGWKIGTQSYGSSVSTIYTASGTTAKTFTAHFAIDERTLEVTSADDEMGTVSVTASGSAAAASGSYGYGTAMSLTAQPRAHYSFTGWYNGGALVSSSNPYNFDLNDNTTLEAHFAIDQHTLTVAVKAGQTTYGSVNSATVNGTYDYGTTKEIVATPETGFEFVEWEEDHNTNASRTVRVEANATYTAVFQYINYSVNITSSNETMGTVGVTPAAPYHYGDVVTATATVTDADAYKFIGWSDNQQNNVTSRSFTITADLTVTAIFTDADKWSVFVQSSNNGVGSVTSDATSVLNGTSVNITATATDPNYEFTGWSDGINDANRTITVTSDTILTANFGPKSYAIAISAGEGGSLHASSAVSGNYAYGTALTLKAVADEANHYHFVQWNDGNQMAERVVTVDGDATYAAQFARDNYAVNVIVDNGGTYIINPVAATYDYGTEVKVGVHPVANYHTNAWTLNGETHNPTAGSDSTALTITGATTFRVFTVKDQYTLNVTSENNNKGFIEGDANGNYDFDQNVTVTATAADNYHFVNWNNDPALDDPELNLTMNENHTYVAYFQLNSHNVQVAAGANGQLTYSINNGAEQNGNINDSYDHGTQITLHAEATTPGYEFDQWSDGGSVNATRTIVVNGDVNINATFKASAYVLTLSVNEPSMGNISYVSEEKATYGYNETVTIRANVSNTNLYKFLSWNDGDTHMVRNITMTSDVDMKALFGHLDMLTVSALSNNNAWGSVEASATSVNLNDDVTITATAAEHYHLIGWSDIDGYNTTATRTGVHITSDTIITAIFAIDSFAVQMTTSAYGASVTGDGIYPYGTQVNIYAEADDHCHFMGWSNDLNSTNNPATITVNNDMTIIANFARDEVHIAASAVNGTVSVSDTTVYYDSVFALTATAAEHYSHFKGWTRNGVAIAGSETINIDATADGIYQATFVIDTVMLSVAVNDPAMGSVNGPVSGQYTYGTAVSLTVVPAAHYHFEGWTGDTTTDKSVTTLTMTLTEDKDVVANFAINSHHMTVDIVDYNDHMGTVTAIDDDYNYGESEDIAATANDGYVFARWSDGSTAATRTVTMGETDITLMAEFDTIYYNVTVNVNDPAMASILGAQAEYIWDDVVIFTAHNFDTNLYKFIGWSDGKYGLDTVRTDTIHSDLNLTAIFTDKEKLSVYVQSNNQAWGSAVASENSVNINHDVTLTATAAAEHHFVAWMNGDDTVSTDAVYNFNVTENVNYTAIFATDRHQVVLTNEDGHAVALTGAGEYDWNENVTISAEAEEHYQFVNWTDENGVEVGNSNPYTFALGSDDTTINANFELKTYTMTLVAENGGSVEGAGSYTALTDATIIATPAHNYTFGGWKLGDEIVSSNDTLTVEMLGDVTYTATFVEDPLFSITLQSENLSMGTVNNVPNTHVGDEVNIVATPKAHYHFVAWVDAADESNVFGTSADTTFDASENLNLVATFHIDTVMLTLEDDGNGTLAESGYYDYGTTVTITAEPAEHYHLYKWYSNVSDSLASTPTYSIRLTKDTTIGATFELNTYNIVVNAEHGHNAIGSGSYVAHDIVSISAEADDNYHFFSWSKNGIQIAGTETMDIEVLGNDTYTAIYSENDAFRVFVQSANLSQGTVEGNESYHIGNDATVSATPKAHFHFYNWTDNNGEVLSTDAEFVITVMSDTTLTANFELDTHFVTLPEVENGTVAGEGYFGWNTTTEISATAAEHYHFYSWQDGNMENPRTITISDDSLSNVYTAVFAIDTHDVTLVAENGTIETEKLRYTYGESATFTAEAAEHYHFLNWNNEVTEPTLTVNIYSDTTVTAIFEVNSNNVTLTNNDGFAETLTGADTYEYDATVSVSAVPVQHYEFVMWQDANGDSVSADNPYVFQMPDEDVELNAVFQLTTYTLTFSAENGSTDIAEQQYTALDPVTVIATAQDTNYTFFRWMKNGEAMEGQGDTLNTIAEGNDSYVAVFTENGLWNLRVYSNNIEMGSVEGDATYHDMNLATVTAAPAEHHHLMYWKNQDNEIVSTDEEYSFNIDENTILTAYFAIDTHHIVFTNNYNGNASEYDFAYGTPVTFTTGSFVGYHFMRFENIHGDTLATENPTLITIVSDTTIVSIHDIDTVNVTLEAENGEIETDTLRYLWGSEATFTAVAAERYHFAGWSNGETDNPITVNLYSDTTVSAVFEKDLQHITIIDDMYGEAWEYDFPWGIYLNLGYTEYEHYHFKGFYDEEGNLIGMDNPTVYYFDTTITIHATYAIDTHEVTLVVDNGAIFYDTLRYTYGATAEFTYEPAENYHFDGWLVDGVDAGNADTLSFTVEGDVTVEALFSIDNYTFTVSSSDMAKGYVTGTQNGTYNNGDAIEVIAHTNQYNVFVGWMSGDDTISTADTLQFNIVSDTTIVAVFASELFSISADVNDSAMGSVEGTGMFTFHSLTTLVAVPAEGHHFVMWSDSLTDISRMVYVEGDVALTAYFAVDTHYVTVRANDTLMGSVSGEGWYNWGDTVTIRAYVNEHFNFLGFNGRTDRVDSISYVVTGDTTFIAYFDYQYLAIYSNFEHGNVNINVAGVQANTAVMPVIAHYGDSIVMTATADTHYHFVNWVEYSLSYDTTVTVDTTYTIVDSTTVDPITGETVTIFDTIDTHIDTVEVITPVYTADTTYAEAEIGYRIYSNRYIDAVFELNQVSLMLLGTHATLEGAGTYTAGDTVTVSATVDEHYVFIGWSDGIADDTAGNLQYNIIDSNLTYTFVIEEDMVLWAITEGEELSVTLIVPDELRGSVDGAGTYHYGDIVTISATSNEGYYFEYWLREDGVTITDSVYSFTIVENVTLTATFHKIGIQSVDQNDVKVYANGDVIYVNGAENQTVRVFDAVGRMVSSSVAEGESIQLHMQASGVYMVQVGNSRAQRVMIVR